MTFPLARLPLDYFADGDRIAVRSLGPVQEARDSLSDLLNRGRGVEQGLPYHVDEDREGSYDSIEDAIEQADADLTADQAIVITIDPRSDRDFLLPSGGLTLPKRHVFIRSSGLYNNVNGRPSPGGTALPRIIGDFDLQVADDRDRTIFSLIGLVHEGRIYGKSNNLIFMKDSHFHQGQPPDGSIIRTHGSEGCIVHFNNVYSNNGQFWINDQDDSPSAVKGAVYVQNQPIFLFPNQWMKVRNCLVYLHNITIHLVNFFQPFSLIDAVDTGARFELFGVDIANFNLGPTTDTRLFVNAESAHVEWGGVRIDDVAPFNSLDIGITDLARHGGAPTFGSLVAPARPPTGSAWKDRTAYAFKMFNGSIWV